MAEKILLVEDDASLQEVISDYFTAKSEGALAVRIVGDGNEALVTALGETFDIILLDVMLPGVDGFTICRELRKHRDTPVIFITARESECDRLHGYSLGCDDYVVKPFPLSELYAKVNVWLRRSRGIGINDEITVGNISMNPYRMTCSVAGNALELPPKEFALLRVLMENQGHTQSRDNLLIRIWGYDFDGSDRVVDNHVRKLRASLGSASAQIKTVRKVGYRLEKI